MSHRIHERPMHLMLLETQLLLSERLPLCLEMHLGMTAASGSHMRHPSPTYKPLLTESKNLSSHPQGSFKYLIVILHTARHINSVFSSFVIYNVI
ncbi:hypothetical protein HanHA300_Chr12g0436911 [Helianthus annuus]|nr:hypothetical protein HanHA300_Chr12g0436911 [Helianthus annuus]